jgi:hypothetical protein
MDRVLEAFFVAADHEAALPALGAVVGHLPQAGVDFMSQFRDKA